MPESSGDEPPRWYRATVPLRLLAMVVVGAFDAVFMVIVLLMSLAVALADFMLSPGHWKERPSAIKVPRPWQMVEVTRELYDYHWRKLVLARPRRRPSPSELWP